MASAVVLDSPFNLIVNGQTQSGKTTFCKALLRNWDRCTSGQLGHVLWMYGLAQPQLFNEIGEIVSNEVSFVEGFNIQCIKKMLEKNEPFTIFMDDLNREAFGNPYFATLFDGIGHHSHCNIIVISQNLFDKSRYFRHAMLNTKYLVLMSSMRDLGSVEILGRQVFPRQPGYISQAFENAMALKPYSHLLLDLSPYQHVELRVRANMFDKEPTFYVHADHLYNDLLFSNIHTFNNIAMEYEGY